MTQPPKLSDARRFTVALGFMATVFDYVKNRGFSLQPLLDVVGISESDLSNPDLRIDDAAAVDLLTMAGEICNDPNIGLHVGQRMHAGHLGTLGLLAMTCESARQVFDLVERYQTLVGDGGQVRFVTEADELAIVYEAHPERIEPYPRHTVESCLIGWSQIAQRIGGAHYHLNSVTISCEAPADSREQEQAFGCPVRYGAEMNSLRMPAEYADIELFAGNPELKELLETQARQRLQELQGTQTHANPVVAQTKQFVAQALAYGVPSIDEAAQQFCSSARTLQRQLDAAGKGYKELVEEVRADLARKYVADSELSLLDVALMLGFSEQSSFQRAFKRWFAKTPGQYRSSLSL